MKEQKLQKLFDAARKEAAPIPPEDFDSRVAVALRREQQEVGPNSLWDQIGQLFPRLAFAVALVIGICLVVEFYNSTTYSASLSAEVNQLSEQWLFAANAN
ncbi:MAG: hypothetical protein JWQ71_2801 [Pedosphaera sp.]|nr:hypothetical protein [Pedosphaera sp.]